MVRRVLEEGKCCLCFEKTAIIRCGCDNAVCEDCYYIYLDLDGEVDGACACCELHLLYFVKEYLYPERWTPSL